MNILNVALDLDGVCYNWHYAVFDYFVGTNKYEGTYENFWNNYINSLSEKEQDYVVSLPFLYESMMITKENLEALNKISELGNLYYLTARHNDLRRVTERWLRKNKLPQDFNLIMSRDKLNYIKLLKIDYFVDDFPSQVDSTKNFCTSFLYAQVWNRECQDKLPTVRSLDEFYNIVKDKQ